MSVKRERLPARRERGTLVADFSAWAGPARRERGTLVADFSAWAGPARRERGDFRGDPRLPFNPPAGPPGIPR